MKTLEAKKEMMEKKLLDKKVRWSILCEDAMHKAELEERRTLAEEKRAMAELIASENEIMMRGPSGMDAFTRESWDDVRMEILQRRRAARHDAPASGGGDGGNEAPASGGGGGRFDDPASHGSA